MSVETNVNQETYNALMTISKLKKCTVNEAARIVLERYAERAKNETERAYGVVDKLKD